MRLVRTAGLVLVVCALLYGLSTAAIYWAMRQPPDRFGAVMRHVPGLAMAVLPFEPLWMRARAGTLHSGDVAPDFNLATVDHSRNVQLSQEFRSQPVVLIFGSYT